jgi:glucose-1-phosphate thymidylyltransferase
MNQFTGVLPAAGLASRLHPFRYPKELLPVLYVPDEVHRRAQPILAAEYSLNAMRSARINRCLVVVAEWKTEIIRYLGDGSGLGIHLAYLHRATPKGLADAVDAAFDWLGNSHVLLALPDTIFYPFAAVAQVCKAAEEKGCDLVLGVFPTREPQQLGPVRFTADGSVLEVLDKPAQTDLYNTWGIAAWSPRFTEFLHECLRGQQGVAEQPLGHIFHRAVGANMRVRAVYFEGGEFIDVGRVEGIGSLILPPNLEQARAEKQPAGPHRPGDVIPPEVRPGCPQDGVH